MINQYELPTKMEVDVPISKIDKSKMLNEPYFNINIIFELGLINTNPVTTLVKKITSR